ncbi:hypothetical protein CV102_24270 [Natronococcus pandeyae]|uniref:UspA domain-containing protein n=1 Tax=Natronococcus pandeyae TaxID=2055836 RepID=A0A8J8Q2R5_9EURY|nr:universal stress protein [Natronococcus pandeyae]TYL36060.1 hypothetical protein CV102_24270 [Natronococcus pandeyae]
MEILVPFAVNPVSEQAVRAAIGLFGSDDRVQIIAVHMTGGKDAPAEIAASEIESMGARQPASVEAEIYQVESGADSRSAVRDMIEEIVESRDIDLVVLGYEEKSIFEQLFETDTTERMLQTHNLPVLLVP